MNKEEKLEEDVLFAVDMQLYNEFNDKLCEINEHLGDIYSYKDLDDVEKAEKEKEIELLREAIKKQQKEIEKYRKLRADIIKVNKKIYDVDIIEDMCEQLANSISKDKIKEKIKEVENREENYTFDKLTSEDIRRTIITNLEELLGGTDGKD